MAKTQPVNGEPSRETDQHIEIDARQLTDIFVVPQWLRDVGLTAWLLVGVALFLAGAVWLLSLTQVIVLPVLTAGIVAAVSSPPVWWLRRHGIPRGLGAALLMLAMILVAVGMTLVVVGGIIGEVSAPNPISPTPRTRSPVGSRTSASIPARPRTQGRTPAPR